MRQLVLEYLPPTALDEVFRHLAAVDLARVREVSRAHRALVAEHARDVLVLPRFAPAGAGKQGAILRATEGLRRWGVTRLLKIRVADPEVLALHLPLLALLRPSGWLEGEAADAGLAAANARVRVRVACAALGELRPAELRRVAAAAEAGRIGGLVLRVSDAGHDPAEVLALFPRARALVVGRLEDLAPLAAAHAADPARRAWTALSFKDDVAADSDDPVVERALVRLAVPDAGALDLLKLESLSGRVTLSRAAILTLFRECSVRELEVAPRTSYYGGDVEGFQLDLLAAVFDALPPERRPKRLTLSYATMGAYQAYFLRRLREARALEGVEEVYLRRGTSIGALTEAVVSCLYAPIGGSVGPRRLRVAPPAAGDASFWRLVPHVTSDGADVHLASLLCAPFEVTDARFSPTATLVLEGAEEEWPAIARKHAALARVFPGRLPALRFEAETARTV